MVDFGFGSLGLTKLRSGHAVDNPASGQVLRKLGFEPHEIVRKTSRSRGVEIKQQRWVLSRPS